MIESVVPGIHRIANTSRKISVKWERMDCPFIHSQKQGRSTSHRGKQRGKTKCPEKKGNIAVANIANHRLHRTSHGSSCKLNSRNAHLEAEGNLEQMRLTKMRMEGILPLTSLVSERNLNRWEKRKMPQCTTV